MICLPLFVCIFALAYILLESYNVVQTNDYSILVFTSVVCLDTTFKHTKTKLCFFLE